VLERILPVFFGLVRNVPALRRHMQHKILGNMSGLGVNYRDSSLSTTSPQSSLSSLSTASTASSRSSATQDALVLRPGDRVCRTTSAQSGSSGWSALLPELADQRWTLLVFSGAEEPAGALRAVEAAHKDWLSVRTVVPDDRPDAPREALNSLIDDGTLRRALDAEPEAWLLIRPDGYLCTRGTRLTEEAFTSLLARLPLTAGRGPAS
jgi:NADPH-dependent dioxygenase